MLIRVDKIINGKILLAVKEARAATDNLLEFYDRIALVSKKFFNDAFIVF